MKKDKLGPYEYPDPTYQEAEIKANRFNLIFIAAFLIIVAVALLLNIFGVFSISLKLSIPIVILSTILFLVPVIVYFINDKILKRERSILQWKEFKYVIYVPVYFGLLAIDIMLSFHAVLLIVVPPLMAAQYRFIRRDWMWVFLTTIVTIPIIIYGCFILGVVDRNLLKDVPDYEALDSISDRLELLTWKRVGELALHHILPRILIIAAIDFLIAAIVQRNNLMLDKQTELSKSVAEEIEKKNKLQSAVIEELASVIETRDISTGHHVKRTKLYVKVLCHRLAKEEKYKDLLSPETINRIISAAPLHDIGKIAVSDTILLKPGKLNEEEYKNMQVHTSRGGEMVRGLLNNFDDDSFIQEAYDIAMYHHEKWNGTGYPEGLKEEQIPLAARIMAIADVFDALVSKRVYKEAYPIDEAFDIMVKDAGKHFDPDMIEALITIKDEFIEIATSNF